MIELTLNRKWYTRESTIGELLIDGVYFSFTLEDVCRDINRDGKLNGPGEEKVQGLTCIPAGRYQVIIDRSNRFKRDMPLIVNVPGFAGIRIHNGNTSKDTDGCILLGSSRAVNFIGHSVVTFDRFFVKLKAILTKHKVYLTIKDLPS